mmetsp:Transcript_15538/g.24515  ORF Transcript_15538/g.24515 Transcript_15538/m.24515 type:complete len:377 (-) Transcript_15538:76-1206(-)
MVALYLGAGFAVLVLLLGVLSASAFSLLGTGATKAPARNGNRNRDDFPAWKDENLILFAKPKKGKSTQNLEEGDDWTQKVLTEVQVQLDANNINKAIERINKAQSELPEGTLLSPEVFAPVIYHAREALDFSLARELTERLLEECSPDDFLEAANPANPMSPDLTHLEMGYFLVHSMRFQDELRPNEDTFRSLLGLAAKAGRWADAVLLARAAEKMGVRLTPFLHDELQGALRRRGPALSPLAQCLYERARRRGDLGGLGDLRRDPGTPPALDLHNMTSALAVAAVRSTLEDMLQRPEDRAWHDPASGPLQVITGQGRNSEDGVAVIKPAVLELLNTDLGIKADVMRYNQGCIELSKAQLTKWVKETQQKASSIGS